MSNLFKVFLTEPSGIVKVCETTNLQVINQRYSDAKNMLSDAFIFHRFGFLKALERDCAADYSKFCAPDLIEHEGRVLTEAKKKAKNINESIKVFADLWEKRGKIITIDWAIVKPDSTVEYIYNPQQFKSTSTPEKNMMDTLNLMIKSLNEQQKLANKLIEKLIRQTEALEEKLKAKQE